MPPSPLIAGVCSVKLTVRKNAMAVSPAASSDDRPEKPLSSSLARQTFRDRCGPFKPVPRSQCCQRRPAVADQCTAGRARALYRNGIDLGDDLRKRDRAAVGDDLT